MAPPMSQLMMRYDHWVVHKLHHFGTATRERAPYQDNSGKLPCPRLPHLVKNTGDQNQNKYDAIQSGNGSTGIGGREPRQQTIHCHRESLLSRPGTKLRDACGVHNAQQIPFIWSVIQASKGKTLYLLCPPCQICQFMVPLTPHQTSQVNLFGHTVF